MKLSDLTSGIAQGFSFSAVRPEILGSTEYTLATIVLDKTGSVASFADELFEIKKRVVEACRKSPRGDFILLRVLEFNSHIDEIHGFMPLPQVDASTYTVPVCCGSTALRDATVAAVSATKAYAKTLHSQDYLVNALVVIITDGDDNQSSLKITDVQREIEEAVTGEHLESLKTILVAVNANVYEPKLRAFAKEAGINEYIDIGDASMGKIARLADFVTHSISSTSQSLGTGGPSAAITF